MADTDLWRDRNKVFVAGIPAHVDDNALYEKFRPFGEMFQSKVVYDSQTGRSKGFGFITFCEYVHALEAVSQMNQQKWENRVLNVRFLQPKADKNTGTNAGAPSQQRRPAKVFGPCPLGCTTVYVGNLAYDITEQVLRKVFEGCGDIKAVRFAEHIETKEFRGFGYVQFYDSAACEKAVQMDGMIVMGRPMNIDYGSRDEATEKAREELQRKLKKGVCHKFQSGECTRGDECKFAHVLSSQDAERMLHSEPASAKATEAMEPVPASSDSDVPVCLSYQKGKCKRGDSCKFQHVDPSAPPASVPAVTVVKEEHIHATTADDDETPMCQSYQKGKCKRGDKCKFRHIDATPATVTQTPVLQQATPIAKEHPVTVHQDTASDIPVCQNYLKGTCKRGEKCRFQHVEHTDVTSAPPVPEQVVDPSPAESKMDIDEDDTPICQNFLKGKCKRGDKCRFRHVDASSLPASSPENPATVPLQQPVVVPAVVPTISICKNFQRGRCTRGTSCRFAHTAEGDSAEAIAAAQARAVAAASVTTAHSEYQKRFQSVCYNWQNTKSCVRGDQCPFFHDGANQTPAKVSSSNNVDQVTEDSQETDKNSKKRKVEGDDSDRSDVEKKKKKKESKKLKKTKKASEDEDSD